MGSSDRSMDILCKHYLHFDELYGAFAKHFGETYFSLWTLEELGENPEGLSHKQLADALHLPKQTVASIVASFQRRGLAESEQSPHDRRSRIVRLTEAGRARYADVTREIHAAEDAALARMDAHEVARMNETCGRLIDLLEEEMKHRIAKEKKHL